jgi:hypothetical protein
MLGLESSIVLTRISRADVPVEAMFSALDGQRFEVDGDPCKVEVYGIFDDGGHRWVQLALAGQRHQMVTLRLAAAENPDCALVSLAVKRGFTLLENALARRKQNS